MNLHHLKFLWKQLIVLFGRYNWLLVDEILKLINSYNFLKLIKLFLKIN